jgi:hypothetical protein
MMSDPTTVDGTTVDELTGKLVLLIEEARAWDEPVQMHRQLAAKVKNYVRHIRGPNCDHPPSETIVRLVSARSPAPASFEFFSRVSYELSKHGVSFEHQVGEDGLPVPIAPDEGVAAGTPPPRSGRQVPSEIATQEAPATPSDARAESEAGARRPAVDRAPAGDEVVGEVPTVEEAEERAAARTEEEVEEEERPGGLPDSWEPEAVEPAGSGPEEIWEMEAPGGEHGVQREVREPDTSAPDLEIEEREPWEPAAEAAAAEDLEDRVGSGALPHFGPQDEEHVEELVSQLESLARPSEERPKYPPFFPEEEFGRAVPERDLDSEGAEIEFLDPESEAAVLETGVHERTATEISGTAVADAGPRRMEADASFSQALGSALASAAAGAAAWGLLAIPADQGAGFLALVVGLMVGMSVRIRGRHSTIFGVMAGALTVLGSALGAILATAVLTARHQGGLSAVAALFAHPSVLGNALFTYYGWVDLAFAAVAVYVAARLAVARR